MLEINVQGSVGKFEYTYKSHSQQGITAIWGRSGAGKTTLLKVIAGLEKPVTGEINYNGDIWFSKKEKKFLEPNNRFIGYVPQDSALFPHMNVKKNLTYAPRSGGRIPNIDVSKISELLNITSLLKRYPAKLSGGETKRVALGRAMLSNPQMLVLDEPFNGLDEELIVEVSNYIKMLNKEFEIPVVLVTHSARDLMRLANHVVVIKHGRVVQSSNVEVFSNELGIVFQS